MTNGNSQGGFDVHVVLDKSEILSPIQRLMDVIDREWHAQIKHKVLLEALDLRQKLTKVPVAEELKEEAIARGFRLAVSDVQDLEADPPTGEGL